MGQLKIHHVAMMIFGVCFLLIMYQNMACVTKSDEGSQGMAFNPDRIANPIRTIQSPRAHGEVPSLRGAGSPWDFDFFVVEEHHEALPYWYDANVKDALLVHLDGHPDMAIPERWGVAGEPRREDRDPNKSRPKSNLYLESNDEFIVSAIAMKMVNTVIWIWPIWDQEGPRHKLHRGGYPIYRIEMISRKKSDGKSCECVTKFANFDPEVWPPWGTNEKPPYRKRCDDVDENDVPLADCDVENGSEAVTIFVSDQWLATNATKTWTDFINHERYKDAILDVDEDHFARIVSGSRVAVAGGKKWFKSYNKILKKLCARKGAQDVEARANEHYVALLEWVLVCNADPESCISKKPTASANFLDSLTCDGAKIDKSVSELLKESLIQKIRDSSRDYIRLLQAVGICLTASLVLTTDNYHIHFRVFDEGGDVAGLDDLDTISTPEEEVLTETPGAMVERLALMQQILPTFKRKYNVGTLCRSVRDGYVPRSRAKQIEDGILQMFPSRWKFDVGLLGPRYPAEDAVLPWHHQVTR